MFHQGSQSQVPPGRALDFGGKVVLVTGGSRGIGRGIASRFVEAGASVFTCGRNPPAEFGRAEFIRADVREAGDVEALLAAITKRAGRLDVLVNNAGGSPAADAATASPRFSAAIVTLNLLAPLELAKRANALMQAQDGGGSIINIASVSALRASPGTAAYGAAKAGLVNLTRSLAVEWAPRVRVNAVSAGPVLTEAALPHFGDEAGQARWAKSIPLGRLGEADDVADACLFLASPLARWITGSNLVVDGGGLLPGIARP